jgi:hypothetical protein
VKRNSVLKKKKMKIIINKMEIKTKMKVKKKNNKIINKLKILLKMKMKMKICPNKKFWNLNWNKIKKKMNNKMIKMKLYRKNNKIAKMKIKRKKLNEIF